MKLETITQNEADDLVEDGKAMYFCNYEILEYNNKTYIRDEEKTHYTHIEFGGENKK